MSEPHHRPRRPTWSESFTIRRRLILLLLALGVPFSIYLVLSSWRQASEERDHAGEQMLAIAGVTAARLDDHIGDIRQLLEVLAQVVDPTPAGTASNDALLRGLADKMPPQIDNLAVWTESGANVGALDERVRAKNPDAAPRNFFKGAMRSDDLVVEAPVKSIANGESVAIFAVAIRRAGKVFGVVTATAKLNSLGTMLSPDRSMPPGAVVTVADTGGVVIARSLDPTQWIGRRLVASGVRPSNGALRRSGILDGPSADGIDRIGGFTATTRVPWLVYVGIPTGAALLPVKERLLENVLVGGAMLALGLIAATVVANRISAALRELSDDAAKLESGDLSHRSRVRQGGEVGALASTLNRMSDALQERTAALESTQAQLRQITDNLPVMIAYLDRDLRFRFVNRVYRDWLGIDPSELLGRTLSEFHGRDVYATFSGHVEQALAGERTLYERDLVTPSATRRIEVTLMPDRAGAGEVRGLYVLVSDVTVARASAARLARSEERLSLALESSNLALFDWDVKGGQIYHSAQAAAIRGDPAVAETATPERMREYLHPDDVTATVARVRATIVGRTEQWDAEFRVRTRAGGWIWLRGKGRVVERDAVGRALRLAGTYADITQRKAVEERLRYLAEFDSLTGLPNRALFQDRLNQAVARARRNDRLMALLFLDIDHFKSVNDTLGHAAGDAVLVDFARMLVGAVRATDTVARLAGDEFTVILEDLNDADDAERAAVTLLAQARRSIGDAGHRVSITTSIGVALVRSGEVDPTDALRRADAALYEAKRLGRDRYALDREGADDAGDPIGA